MSFSDRHQTIWVNYRGSYVEVTVRWKMDDTFNLTVEADAHIDRYCKECDKPSNSGLVFRGNGPTLSTAVQHLLNRLYAAVQEKRIIFEDGQHKGFRVAPAPEIMCCDCRYWPRLANGHPVDSWSAATCPGGPEMNIFDGKPYLRAEYDASDCEHFQPKEKTDEPDDT